MRIGLVAELSTGDGYQVRSDNCPLVSNGVAALSE
jgi:hypothetical protein